MPSRQEVLANLIREHNWMRGAELGVWKGDTLFYLLNTFPNLEMVGVDKYTPEPPRGPQDKNTGYAPYDPVELMHARDYVMRKVKHYEPRLSLIQATTDHAVVYFQDKTFDFVFIDADHSSDAVERDIRKWMPKVKAGGALLGHDADWPSVRDGYARVFETPPDMLEGNVWKWEVR